MQISSVTLSGPIEELGRPRHPVTMEIAGSNPAGIALESKLGRILGLFAKQIAPGLGVGFKSSAFRDAVMV